MYFLDPWPEENWVVSWIGFGCILAGLGMRLVVFLVDQNIHDLWSKIFCLMLKLATILNEPMLASAIAETL